MIVSDVHLAAQAGDLLELPVADACIAFVVEGAELSTDLRRLDERLGAVLTNLRQAGDLTGKPGELVTVWSNGALPARRLLFAGLGRAEAIDRRALSMASASAARNISGKPRQRVHLLVPEVLSADEAVLATVTGVLSGCEGPGLRKSEKPRHAPAELLIVGQAVSASDALQRAGVEARAVSLARELVNTPPAELGPEEFVRRAESLALESMSVEVFTEQRLEAERMGALLAVGRGSARLPRLLIVRYQGGSGPLLALVGKGVTFDSGGLSLKTSEQMVDMKCDMAGAAAVFAATRAAAELKLPVNLLTVIPLAENMPGGRAMKLGDVLTARNGTTIEVLNTDAEGRLVLADALSYAVEQEPAHLVDLATLTGACMIALGTDTAGLMGNNADWNEQVLSAVRRSGERAWPLPIDSHYDDMLKSQVADIRNTGGGRYGGAIAGAKFLEKFVAGRPWAHLDIAGPAWADHESSHRDAGGTGYGVRSLIELLHGYGR